MKCQSGYKTCKGPNARRGSFVCSDCADLATKAKGKPAVFIQINGSRVYFDPESFEVDRELRLDNGSLSEQCEGCGNDILETAAPIAQNPVYVRCTHCGMIYQIEKTKHLPKLR